jgi:hypothetical protein
MLTGNQITRMMRKGRVTIRELARHMDITMKRVRQVRNQGISGDIFEWEWTTAIKSVACLEQLKHDTAGIEVVRPGGRCQRGCSLIPRVKVGGLLLCPEHAADFVRFSPVAVVT